MKAQSREFRIRGYEVDSSRTLAMPVALSYLEQMRWAWMIEPEWDLMEGVRSGHFFVVRRQELELVERPRFDEQVTVTGWMEHVGRSQVIVRHQLWVEGRCLGHARVHGVWLGPNRRLARMPDAVRTLGRAQAAASVPFGTLVGGAVAGRLEGNPDAYLDAPRVVFPAVGLGLEPDGASHPLFSYEVTVRPSDCDVFEHVNASQYMRYCQDALASVGMEIVPNHVLLDYHQEALAGEVLTLVARGRRGCTSFTINRGDTLLCDAVVCGASLD